MSEFDTWSEVTNEETYGTSSEGILEKACQLGIAVGYAALVVESEIKGELQKMACIQRLG